jgi:SHS2 domain-containing protein
MHADAEGYEFVEHTADLAVRARATGLPDLFVQAAKGMYALLGELRPGAQAVETTIEVHAPDAEGLLHDWLAELLWQVDSQHCLFEHFRFSRFDAQHLTAHCKGTFYDPQGSERAAEIKAVTYHDLRIEKRGDVYEVTVVFDV